MKNLIFITFSSFEFSVSKIWTETNEFKKRLYFYSEIYKMVPYPPERAAGNCVHIYMQYTGYGLDFI